MHPNDEYCIGAVYKCLYNMFIRVYDVFIFVFMTTKYLLKYIFVINIRMHILTWQYASR